MGVFAGRARLPLRAAVPIVAPGAPVSRMAPNEPEVRPTTRPTVHTAVALGAILLTGAVLRGCYFAELADSPELAAPAYDAAFHDHWARALWSGDWSPPRFFADPELRTSPYFRPPGYPHFLAALYALTGGSPLGARALQMALGLANAALAFLLGRALLGRAAGLCAAAGMACTWTVVYFEGELLAPVLEIALLLGALLACERWRRVRGWGSGLAAGLLLGLFAVTRPNALVLAPVVWVFGLWVAARAGGPRRPLLLGLPLGLLAAIAPVTIRNFVVAGDFVAISSNGGVNLWIGNNEHADGHTARIPALGEFAALQGWTCFDEPAIRRGVERIVGRPLLASEVSSYFAGRAWDHVLAHPGHALALAARKAALFWGPLEVANNREDELARADSAVLRWLPGFPWLLSLAVLGALRLARELRRSPGPRRDCVLLLAACVLVYFASHLPFFVAGRYRMPLVPLLWLFAGHGVAGVFALARDGRRAAAAKWAAAWLMLLGAAHVPLTGYRPDPGQWHFQRGDALRMAGDLDAAVAEFRLAIERAVRPDPLPHNNLGAALLQQGRLPEAIASFRAALVIAPGYVHARFNLALALANTGRDDLACDELGEVLRADPGFAGARGKLGALLVRRGRPADALPHLEAAAAGDRTSQYLLAVALLDLGRAGDARAQLEDLVEKAPRFADALVVLAELLAQGGHRERAVRLLQQALAAAPGHPGATSLLARLR